MKRAKHEWGTMFCATINGKAIYRCTNWYETLTEARGALKTDFESGLKVLSEAGLGTAGIAVIEPFRIWQGTSVRCECMLLAN